MSTLAQLPASAEILGNPSGNGGYTGGWDPSGREEMIPFKVAWEDRFAFENVVNGLDETVTVGGVSITRRVPLQSPYNPSQYAVGGGRFKSTGKVGTTPAKPYNTLIYQINFGYLPFSVSGDTAFASLRAQGGVRSLTMPNRRYAFSNGEVIDHGVAITHPGTSYQFTKYNLPDIVAFDNAMRALMAAGPVNSAPITLAGRAFGAGEILVETYSTDETKSLFGMTENSATVVVNWSALPWNKLVRSDGVLEVPSPAPYTTSALSALTS